MTHVNTATRIELEAEALKDDNLLAYLGGEKSIMEMDTETLREKMIEWVMTDSDSENPANPQVHSLIQQYMPQIESIVAYAAETGFNFDTDDFETLMRNWVQQGQNFVQGVEANRAEVISYLKQLVNPAASLTNTLGNWVVKIEQETGIKSTVKKYPKTSSMRGYIFIRPRKVGNHYPSYQFDVMMKLKAAFPGEEPFGNRFTISGVSIYIGEKLY